MRQAGGFVTIILLAAVGAWAQQPAPPITSPPNVQILVLFDPLLGYEGTVSYAKVVPREEARAELAELAGLLGYAGLEELRPFDPSTGKRSNLRYRSTEAGCELSFRLSEKALGRAQGTFRLEPFIAAYRQYKRINLEFYVSPLSGVEFAYRGIGDYDNAYVSLRHQGAGELHSFQVEVLNPAFESLDLPPFAPPEVPLGEGSKPPAEATGRSQAGAVVLGLGLSLLVYLALYGWLARRRHRTQPRRRRWHR